MPISEQSGILYVHTIRSWVDGSSPPPDALPRIERRGDRREDAGSVQDHGFSPPIPASACGQTCAERYLNHSLFPCSTYICVDRLDKTWREDPMGEPDAGHGDVSRVSAIGGVLEQLGVTDAVTLAEAAILHLDHPRWAVWQPVDGSGWAAVRPAGRRPPGPEVPMLWVRADTAAELGRRMSRADAELSPPDLAVVRRRVPLPPWRCRLLIGPHRFRVSGGGPARLVRACACYLRAGAVHGDRAVRRRARAALPSPPGSASAARTAETRSR